MSEKIRQLAAEAGLVHSQIELENGDIKLVTMTNHMLLGKLISKECFGVVHKWILDNEILPIPDFDNVLNDPTTLLMDKLNIALDQHFELFDINVE